MNIMNNLSNLTLVSMPGQEASWWEIILRIYKDMYGVENLLRIFANIIYTVISFAMQVIDFMFIIIRQLCGINTDFSSLDNVVENDVIFKFIFSENVVTIVRSLIILAIVLILVFSIIAIIKNEYKAVQDNSSSGEIKNDKSEIWKNIFRSIILLFLVPVVLFGGIIMSNAVLQTLYNATAGYNNASIGTQIFLASSYDANEYRNYALNNKKIPITYNFNKIKDYSAITDLDPSGSVSELEKALLEYKQAGEWTQGWTTFTIFFMEDFFNMDTIDLMQQNASAGGEDTEESKTNLYNLAYDTGIRTYKYEYFVNGELINYMMQSGKKIYLLTAEDVVKSCAEAGVNIPSIFKDDENGYYRFSVNYNDGKDAINYYNKFGATDEADGAVFIACIQDTYKTTQNGKDIEKTYFKPLVNGQESFETDYLVGNNNFIVMRGMFDDQKYPTAIRKVNGGIQYYRERLNIPTYSSFLPRISYELPEGTHESWGIKAIKAGIKMFSGVDMNEYLPYVYFDIDLTHLFQKSTTTVATFNDSGFYLDYMFTSKNMDMSYVYCNYRLNPIILILVTTTIFGSLFKAILGILKRITDIAFLYVMYPAAIAVVPLDGSGYKPFKKWTYQMILKVLSMYGLVVAINIGIILLSLSKNMTIFTAADLANTPFNWMANSFTVGILNTIVILLFYLVGISFIFQIPKIIQGYVSTSTSMKDYTIKGMEPETQEVMQYGEKVVKGTTDVYKKAVNVISGKAAVDKIKGLQDWVPGSAIVKDLKKRKNDRNVAKSNNLDAESSWESLKNMMGGDQGGNSGEGEKPKPPAGGNGGAPNGGETPENANPNSETPKDDNPGGSAPNGGETPENANPNSETPKDDNPGGSAPNGGDGGEAPATSGEAPAGSGETSGGEGSPENSNPSGGESRENNHSSSGDESASEDNSSHSASSSSEAPKDNNLDKEILTSADSNNSSKSNDAQSQSELSNINKQNENSSINDIQNKQKINVEMKELEDETQSTKPWHTLRSKDDILRDDEIASQTIDKTSDKYQKMAQMVYDRTSGAVDLNSDIGKKLVDSFDKKINNLDNLEGNVYAQRAANRYDRIGEKIIGDYVDKLSPRLDNKTNKGQNMASKENIEKASQGAFNDLVNENVNFFE